jgi:broad specificity phosphatase PhoE
MADFLVVIRSGATDYDLQGRIRGNLDIPLAPAGIAAVRETARHLTAAPPVALYTSPTTCAIETADVIGDALEMVPRRVPHLVGLDLGLWQGMLVSEIRRRQPRLARHWEEDPWTVVPPDGEPLSAARDRIAQAIGKIVARHPGERVAVVVPQPIDRIIRSLLTGDGPGDLWEIAATAPAAVELRVSPPTPQPPLPPTGFGVFGGATAFATLRGRLGLAPS